MSRSLPSEPTPIAPVKVSSGSTRAALTRTVEYVLAVLLPWAATWLSFHVDALRGIRLALSFAACAGTATYFGLGPAVVAIGVTAVVFNHYVAPLQTPAPTPTDRLVRTLAILAVGFVIASLTRQKSAAQRKLLSALGNVQEQADALMQAQQASRSAAWTFDVRARQTRWYEGGAEIFGRPHGEITAMGSPTSLVLEEDRGKVAAAAELTIRTGAPFCVEFRVAWPNGEVHWLEARGEPLATDRSLWRGATIDVTDRKLAEAALIRTEKLAVAGRLAASIAHEINNPLEAVVNLCYLAKKTSIDPESKEYLEMAEAELGRIAHITSQTLRFHRQQTAASATDLGETLRAIVSLYQHKLTLAEIVVDLETAEARAMVCYAGEIRQVLANLIANALDAMPQGGRLRLRLRETTDWRRGVPAVRITVADTGSGMTRETRQRIYEPFYTTKGDVGTGLGLWVTAGIVEKHGGSLRLRSSVEPGRSGTAFCLVLPYPATEEKNASPLTAHAGEVAHVAGSTS